MPNDHKNMRLKVSPYRNVSNQVQYNMESAQYLG